MSHFRDKAFSVTLPNDTGAIQAMKMHRGHFEIYTLSATYLVQTADQMDPKREVADMPPAGYTRISSVGASHPIVARTYLQIAEIMGSWPLKHGTTVQILEHFHDCKDALVSAERVANAILAEFEKIKAEVNANGIPNSGGALNCPHLPNLEHEIGEYLRFMKLAIQAIGEVFNDFHGLTAASGPKPVKNGNFQFATAYLKGLADPYLKQFIDMLDQCLPMTSWLINARNAIEHNNKTFIVENFKIVGSRIEPPSWGFPKEKPASIHLELIPRLAHIVDFTEIIFGFAFLDNVAMPFPFPMKIGIIPPKEIDPNCPQILRLERDFSQHVDRAIQPTTPPVA
jgi:hypothetical protein